MMHDRWTDGRVPNASGVVRESFAETGDAFGANFDEGLELGACFAVIKDGELVADIRGGFSDKAKETPWTEDTLACIYSTGKAAVALLMAQAVSGGHVDYDKPVAAYWPEFSEHSKAEITVAEALSHQDGLCALPEGTAPETYLDWEKTCAIIAGMTPLWTPGTANGYHPQTYGFIAGEIIRRTTGKTVGAHLRDVQSADGIEIHCGMHTDDLARAAYMPKPPRAPDLGAINEFKKLAFLKPSSSPARVAREDWMAAEIPASNMHADADALARFLYPLANEGRGPDGAPVIDPGTVQNALKERIRGDDLVLPFHLSWSAGLMRNINRHFGPNENAFGHAGFGGSAIVIDPENRLVAAYVMNKMSPHLVGDPRFLRLINAVYDAM